MKAKIVFKGGKGSGNHGHQGLAGVHGGSSSGGGSLNITASNDDPASFELPGSKSTRKTSEQMEDWGTPVVELIALGTELRPNAIVVSFMGEGIKPKRATVPVSSLMKTSDGELLVSYRALEAEGVL